MFLGDQAQRTVIEGTYNSRDNETRCCDLTNSVFCLYELCIIIPVDHNARSSADEAAPTSRLVHVLASKQRLENAATRAPLFWYTYIITPTLAGCLCATSNPP